MIRKLLLIATLSLVAIAFLTSAVFAEKRAYSEMERAAKILKNTKFSLSGAERPLDHYSPNGSQSLGADAIVSNSPGLQVGLTTYDLQANTRMQRQVDWRGAGDVLEGYNIHFDWMKQVEDSVPGGDRGTGYEVWDAENGFFVFNGTGGGCDIHPRLGSGNNYSGYVGLDVDTESKVVIYNHHDEGAGYASTIWYDFTPAACFFSPYKRRPPDDIQWHCVPEQELGEFEMIWPMAEYQVWDGDTVTHVISMQFESEIDPSLVTYFRRVGSDTVGAWDDPPMCVDTIPTISQSVTASRVSGKVALVWQAPPGAFPGSNESWERDWVDDGLGVNQRTNDVFYKISGNMGSSWGATENMTDYDSTVGGYLGHGDMSVLIGTDDYLHVLFNARVILGEDDEGYEGGLGEYTNFWGSRLLHWDEFSNSIRPVKDANWNIADTNNSIDSLACSGGAWNEMSIVKPMLSECDGKFYAFFVQFLDLHNGIYDDCATSRWDGTGTWQGTANGEIYVSVSDNGGLNWDVARNLTQTYTPNCQQDGDGGLEVCESDHYVSTSRFGMYMDPADDPDFIDAVIVTPEGGTDNFDYYIDVQYINDKHPGSVMQDDGVWSYNPVKWFRVPCVEPIPNPVLAYLPATFGLPTWTKPNVTKSLVVTMENVGNATLTINDVSLSANDPSGSASVTGFTAGTIPADGTTQNFSIDINYASTAVVTGTADIDSDHLNEMNNIQQVTFEIIVADTVQFPEYATVSTECLALTFSNAGNAGNGGDGDEDIDDIGNLNYFDDCDTTGNQAGDNDRATVYLYDASPFICRIDGNDTTMFHYMFNDNAWLTPSGFKPLEGVTVDADTYDAYEYGYSGKMVTPDSSIAVEVEYFAPKGGADTCDFVVMKQRIYNNSGAAIANLFMGDAMDWDIPSDSGSANGSDFDETLMSLWCFGAEYAPDSITNDDCRLADQRYGGFAYYGGFRLPAGRAENDSIYAPKAQWSENNADWVYPDGDFVGGEIWDKCANTDGYETWEATGDFSNPDSMFTDLHTVCVFGNYDLGATDTMIFVKIVASEYDGGENAFKATIAKAKAWIALHPEIFAWPVFATTCCEDAGDADDNGSVNILDITKLIGYLYQQLPPGPCLSQMDADGNNSINILDITKLIGFLYQQLPPPICGQIDK